MGKVEEEENMSKVETFHIGKHNLLWQNLENSFGLKAQIVKKVCKGSLNYTFEKSASE
jgi:hypothetical protein